MDATILYSLTEKYFRDKSFKSQGGDSFREIDLLCRKGNIDWAIAILADQPNEVDYLKAFEKGMQSLIAYDQHDSASRENNFALALAFDSTLGGKIRSYRRALNKYSNSIIFEDLGIHLLLAHDDGRIEHYVPDDVNLFLRKLNIRIAAEKSRT